MTVDHESTPTAAAPGGLRGRWRALARQMIWRVAGPYARLRAREAQNASSLARLQSDFERVSERHGEQIERLEDVTRELILAAETLRRDIHARRAGGDG